MDQVKSLKHRKKGSDETQEEHVDPDYEKNNLCLYEELLLLGLKDKLVLFS